MKRSTGKRDRASRTDEMAEAFRLAEAPAVRGQARRIIEHAIALANTPQSQVALDFDAPPVDPTPAFAHAAEIEAGVGIQGGYS